MHIRKTLKQTLVVIGLAAIFSNEAGASYPYYWYLGPLLPLAQTDSQHPKTWACYYGAQPSYGSTIEQCQYALTSRYNAQIYRNPSWLPGGEFSSGYALLDQVIEGPPNYQTLTILSAAAELGTLHCPGGSSFWGNEYTCACPQLTQWDVLEQWCTGTNLNINLGPQTFDVPCNKATGTVQFAFDIVSWPVRLTGDGTVTLTGGVGGKGITSLPTHLYDAASGISSFVYDNTGAVVSDSIWSNAPPPPGKPIQTELGVVLNGQGSQRVVVQGFMNCTGVTSNPITIQVTIP